MSLNIDLNHTQNLEQVLQILEIGCVPKVPSDEDHVADRDKTLLAHLEIAKLVLNKLNNLLSKLINNDVVLQVKLRDIINPCLYLCGEHCRSNLPWSDNESHSIMNVCIEKLCKLMHYSNMEELFTYVDVSKVFIGLQYKLKNDNWKNYPAAVECFIWSLKYLKVRYSINTLIFCI